MSWPQWAAAAQPPLQAAAAAASVLNPAAAGAVLNSAATVVPSGIQYTPDQWAQLQQQNWTQWAQWQQQYQQWHQQYGAEYQKSLSALSTQMTQQSVGPTLPNLGVPPPLPTETKPPLPLDDPPINQQNYPNYNTTAPNYTTVQNKLPETNRNNWQQNGNKRNFEQSQQNIDNDTKRQMVNKPQWPNQSQQQQQQQQQQPKPSPSHTNTTDELTEAEKKFDKQFAEWEAQFNKWKEQNAEHPDKQQYKEYEKKWESWRAQLLERREQMRRKRLGLLNETPRTQQFPKEPPQFPIVLPSNISNNNKITTSKNDEIFKTNINDDGGIFLKACTSGGIPGLDLVSNDNKNDNDDGLLVDQNKSKIITTSTTIPTTTSTTTASTTIFNSTGPDLDAISKGINSILGDQKLLNMLSIVSQNPNININDQLMNTSSRNRNDNQESLITTAITTTHSENSNQSHDNYTNQNENYNNQRDFVNNFDDQTRSSFTIGPNDGDIRYDNNYNRNQSRYETNHFNNNLNKTTNRFGNDNFKNDRFRPRNDDFDNYNESNRQFPLRDRQYDNKFNDNQYDDERFNTRNNYNTRPFDNEFDQSRPQYNHDSDYRQNFVENFNETRNHDRMNPPNLWMNDENDAAAPPPPPLPVDENIPPEEPVEILQPATVVDYDHKPLKPPEPEILIEPIRMFDYRHKSLSRIPLPQRPKWLSETVRNIREFDPPVVVRPYEPQNLRRYPNIDNWRNERLYIDDSWIRYKDNNRNLYDERRSYQEKRQYDKKEYQESITNRNINDDNDNKRRQFNQFNENKPGFDDKKNHYQDDYDEKTQLKNFESDRYNNKNDNNKQHINRQVTSIEDLINPPGRYNRPPRICIILRGPPGSGKTFLAKLIKDKEVENGGSPPRILSLDDYFMVEQEKEIVEDGKRVKIKEMIYEYEVEMEESYRMSLMKSFRKTITDGYFPFIIVDNVNDKVKYFGEMWSFAKQNGFQVYICQLDLDVHTCSKRNIHGRSESDIDKLVANWEPTPTHHPILDATCLLQSGSIPDVEMEEVNSPESDSFNDKDDVEEEDDEVTRSKWDNFDCSIDNLAKLDGVNKPLRPSRTMEEYLQMDIEWTPTTSTKPGQKRVRWADLEEQKEQAKMRAIGFVVGQTNWDRMMDPTMGGSALTQTKYIERSGRGRY